jgi:lipopolysaccharide transport system permease protein
MNNELVIRAGASERQYWRDLWRYRELLYFLAWRDILVRYKQTVAGIGWALLRPFVTMVVFTIVFGKFAKMPSGGVPYPILVFTALLPWQFFANALAESGASLVSNANLISKVYFPRMVVPASAVVTSFVDFLISIGFLVALMIWYQYLPDWKILCVPLFTLLAFAAAMGAGLWLGALTVRYRDFRIIAPFIIQFGFFISPVGYSSNNVPDQWRLLYSLNPLAGIIDGFRWAVLGQPQQLYIPGIVSAIIVTAFLFWTGIAYFRRTEKSFADVI